MGHQLNESGMTCSSISATQFRLLLSCDVFFQTVDYLEMFSQTNVFLRPTFVHFGGACL